MAIAERPQELSRTPEINSTPAPQPEAMAATGVIKVLGWGKRPPLTWHKDNPARVAEVEAEFRALCARGHQAYRIETTDGEAVGTRITTFDPEAQEIVMFGQLKGGSDRG